MWVRLFCRHVAAGAVLVVPPAVCRSGSGRSEDRGEPLEAAADPAGEPDSGGPYRPAGLGGGGVEGGAGRPAGDEPGPDPKPSGVR